MNTELDRERISIVQDIVSADEEIRRLAVERMLTLPSSEAIPFLVESLGDASWRVRKSGVERLVSCSESTQVVEALIGALGDDENPGRRNSAVEALIHSGAEAVPALVETLGSPDVDVRKLAVDTLAGIGHASSRDALAGLLSDVDSNVRAAAADALGVIGGAGITGRLTELALDDEQDRLVRLSALRALSRLEASLAPAELEAVAADSVLRPAVYTLLGHVGENAALDMLLKGVVSSSRGAREAAMAALLQRLARTDTDDVNSIGERLREAVGESRDVLELSFERLREADLPTRLMLVQFLGLLALPECALPILEAGRDEALAEVVRATLDSMGADAEKAIDAAWEELDADLLSSACDVLGLGVSERGASRLRQALAASDRMLRTAAAEALGLRRCGDSLGDLFARLEVVDEEESDWEDERDALVEALAALGRPAPEGGGLAEETVLLMASKLDTALPGTRLSIAAVLGEIGVASRGPDGELISVLLRDPIPKVRRAAVQTVARLDPSRARELLRLSLADESPVVRVAAALALGHSDEPGVLEDLQGLLLDEDARSRAAAVRAIGNYCARVRGSEVRQGVSLIAGALRDHCLVALAGVEALDAIGGDEAAGAACAALTRAELELVQAAAQCVGRHGAFETLGELLPLLPHESWMVRAEVIQILGERRFVQAVPAILRGLENEQHEFVRDTILAALKRLED